MAYNAHRPGISASDDTRRERSVTAGVRIAPPDETVVRLLGSHPSAIPLRRRDDDEPPDRDPDDRVPPPPPTPAISAPDFAMQFSPCPEDVPRYRDLDVRTKIIVAMRRALGGNPDVRYTCAAGTGRIGVWLRRPASPGDSAARERGLEVLDVVRPGELFAVFVNSGLIRRAALETGTGPKRLDGNGQPDPQGPIHLTGSPIVAFEPPNRVLTSIVGFDERPWPDVNFTVTLTDTLSVSADGAIRCTSETTVDVDQTWLDQLSRLFLSLSAFMRSALIPAAVFAGEALVTGFVDPPDDPAGGAGCGAARLIPQEIMLEGAVKVIAAYDRVSVSSGGLFAGGSYAVFPRIPVVTITGETDLAGTAEGTAIGTFAILTDDLRKPLAVTWVAEGTVLNPGAPRSSVRFAVTGAVEGDVLTRRVAVTVRDADGLVAQADVTVRIHVVVIDDSDGPPICRRRPWLPQCRASVR